MAKPKEKSGTKNVINTLAIIILLLLIVSMISGCASLLVNDIETGNVAIIPVHGVISIGDEDMFGQNVASPDFVREQLQKAENNNLIKVILVEINSPGGAPVASAEIAQLVKDANKPVVTLIREIGTSGGYWVASAGDRVFAHELSTTGSIGVLGSYLEFSEFLKEYNITYNRQVAGEYKDMGTPLKTMTQDEQWINRQRLDAMHEIFIREVAHNRNMEFDTVKKLANGQVYMGFEAYDNGLVDELGGVGEVTAYIEGLLNESVEYVRYEKEVSILDALTSFNNNFAQNIGFGMGSSLVKTRQQPII